MFCAILSLILIQVMEITLRSLKDCVVNNDNEKDVRAMYVFHMRKFQGQKLTG